MTYFQGSKSKKSSEIKVEFEIGLQILIAKLNANVAVELENDQEELFRQIDIKIYGSVKKPIIALTLLDLIDDLRKIKENPGENLTLNPLYFSCIPLSTFLNRPKIEMNIQKYNLQEIHELAETFKSQFQIINTLLFFAKDVSENRNNPSENLAPVTSKLKSIQNAFAIQFDKNKEEWIQLMERK